MAFVKLDCGILDSTIWGDREARELFITALLMAKPVQVHKEMVTYEVQGLGETGFIVPPGWYGLVEAAGVGIISRAKMEVKAGLAALERLGLPEADSRTPDFDGRRLVRVQGGYIVLNFARYREKDHTAAIRSKRYRLNKKAGTKTKRQVKSAFDGREARYQEALERGDEAAADRIAAEDLPGGQ